MLGHSPRCRVTSSCRDESAWISGGWHNFSETLLWRKLPGTAHVFPCSAAACNDVAELDPSTAHPTDRRAHQSHTQRVGRAQAFTDMCTSDHSVAVLP